MTTLQPVQPAQPYQPQPQQKGWWGRNWKWFVPVGCLSMLLITIAVVGLLVWSIFSAVTGMMKSSEAYKQGIARVQTDPAVAARLGSPIDASGMPSGNIQVNNASGDADLAVPISGPNGDGTLYIVADKSGGRWTFTTLVVEIEATGEQIDLLAGHGPP